jgi:putative SOS response-associated peptidase YedK
MCGRFTATFEFREIKLRWNIQNDIPLLAPRYNIAPSQEVPIIVLTDAGNELKQMRWGLVPSWTNDPSIGNRMINARAETLTEKPSFKGLLRNRRCLVPADGFYEWRKEGKRKVPVWIHLKNREPFVFAGLWDRWRDPAGGEIDSFTIITTKPNTLLRPIHDRMPAILDNIAGKSWLDPLFVTEPTMLPGLLQPFPAEPMEAHDVSSLVNSPVNDSAQCIAPV